VLLVVNQNNKGIPIGYLLFSAASGAQRTSSSYNHAILKELLKQYKDELSIENNCEFLPKVSSICCIFLLFICNINQIYVN
jgi:hypothetical protein